jgi:hypothetical protein
MNTKVHHDSIPQLEANELQVLEEGEILEVKHNLDSDHFAGANTATTNHDVMSDGSLDALTRSIELTSDHVHHFEIQVQYRGLTFWNSVPDKTIETVGSAFLSLFGVGGKTHRVNIINDLTGRILPKRMTLVMGPPGSGEFCAYVLWLGVI